MKILLVSATYKEVEQIVEPYFSKIDNNIYSIKSDLNNIDLIISGIGTPFTLFNLTTYLTLNKYDLVINVGIAGSFNRNISLGEIVLVKSDRFADLGIDDKGSFSDLFECGFVDENEFPFRKGRLIQPNNTLELISDLKNCNGITVNTTSGSEENIMSIRRKYEPNIETMEGAAVFYVALQLGINVVQIRSISNYVEPRNKANWNFELAVRNLNSFIIDKILTVKIKK